MLEFIGKSGKYYIKNPFGGTKYTYACYQSKLDLTIKTGYLGHLSSEEAFKDFEKVEKEKRWKFTLQIGKAKKQFVTDLQGNILEPKNCKENFSDYYTRLVKKYGRENVKKQQQIIQ